MIFRSWCFSQNKYSLFMFFSNKATKVNGWQDIHGRDSWAHRMKNLIQIRCERSLLTLKNYVYVYTVIILGKNHWSCDFCHRSLVDIWNFSKLLFVPFYIDEMNRPTDMEWWLGFSRCFNFFCVASQKHLNSLAEESLLSPHNLRWLINCRKEDVAVWNS